MILHVYYWYIEYKLTICVSISTINIRLQFKISCLINVEAEIENLISLFSLAVKINKIKSIMNF